MPDINRQFQEEARRITDKYSTMPLARKIRELDRLRNRKKRLESDLATADVEISFLQNMPDIAEQAVLADRVALDILSYLNAGGSYRSLLDKDYGSIVFSRIHLLETARLIEVDRSRDSS